MVAKKVSKKRYLKVLNKRKASIIDALASR